RATVFAASGDPVLADCAGGYHLISTPYLCYTDDNGQLSYTYTSTARLGPVAGQTDTLTAALDQNGGGAVTTSYTYGPIHLDWSQTPIAATSSLAASDTVRLTVTAFDSAGHPAAATGVYSSFERATVF